MWHQSCKKKFGDVACSQITLGILVQILPSIVTCQLEQGRYLVSDGRTAITGL